MLCDIEVQDTPTVVTDDEKAIERAESDPTSGSRRGSTALAAAALRCGSLRSPSLRSAPANAPEERTPREFTLISSFFFLAPLIN